MNSYPFRLTCAAAVVAAATLPVAGGVLAQDDLGCERLLTLVDEAGDNLREEFGDARAVGEAGNMEECAVYVTRVTETGGLTTDANTEVQASTQEESTETVQVEQEATIEGEVEVTLPDPRVEVEQDPADVSVRTLPPEVNVSQGQPKITVRQAQPIITVQMTQPTITVEQPAPEIIVTMPEPGVDVATARPTVEVNIPEPRVTVTQGQPQLAVDLQTDVGDEADVMTDSSTLIERSDEGGSMVVRASGLSSGEVEPNIQYVENEEPPTINFSGVEPQVEYVAAEPDVRIESGGEPTIEMVEGGEPKIMIQSADQAAAEGEEPAASGQAVAALDAENGAQPPPEGQRDPREAFAAAEEGESLSGDSGVMTVEELAGMDVRNARGEELGEVNRIVRNGNDTYMVIEHGGWFLGLNDKEVALPITDVTVRENEVVLRGLTEEQIEAMPDYDYANEIALEGNDEVTLQRVN